MSSGVDCRNLDTATKVKILRKHTGALTRVCFSTTGRKLWSGGQDRLLRAWGVDGNYHPDWQPEQGYTQMQQMTTITKKQAEVVSALAVAPSDGCNALPMMASIHGYLRLSESVFL